MLAIRVLVLVAAMAFVPRLVLGAGARLGVALIHPDRTGCVAVEGRLRVGDSLVVAVLDPAAVLHGRVESALEGGCVEHQGVVGDSVSSYAIRLWSHDPIEHAMGVAVIAAGATGTVEQGRVAVRVPGTGRPYTFRSCASMEGIHFTAWQRDRRVWHAYYYVPFDLEADCTDEEIGEQGEP